MVARHEIPGKRADMIRPVGNGVIRSATPVHRPRRNNTPANQSYRFPIGRLVDPMFPGILCLATIILSLRDRLGFPKVDAHKQRRAGW